MIKAQREYYAAANGYSGFRSYFDEVFDAKKMLGIYILKGGPGTGKSTLMKKVLKHFCEMGYTADAVYCSSDPSSLDGVIIDGRVAILDGTAPHERDTKLPGALDEIINLGEAWDTKELKNKRPQIEKLNKAKKQNYNSAYKYLSFSGIIHDYKLELLSQSFDFDSAEKRACELIKELKKEKVSPEKILISSFSKEGLSRRSLSGFNVKKLYSVNGNFGEEELFLNVLRKLSVGNYPLTIIPSPLSDNITEGVYFKNEGLMFLSGAEGRETVDASQFLEKDLSEEIEFLNKNEASYLEKSKLHFKKASEFHFLLEDIYRESMDFQKNDEVFLKLLEKITKLLSD